MLAGISIILFFAFTIVNSLFFQPITLFPSNALLVCGVFLVGLGLILFRQMLGYTIEDNIFTQSVFWYNIAVIFFYSSTFLLWSSLNYFIRHKLNTQLLIDMIYVANLIYYILIGISFYMETIKSKGLIQL